MAAAGSKGGIFAYFYCPLEPSSLLLRKVAAGAVPSPLNSKHKSYWP